MIYKKRVELSDLIAYVNVFESREEAIIKGRKLSRTFQANFWLKDFGKAWIAILYIEVENEEPRLVKVTTYGKGTIPVTNSEKTQTLITLTNNEILEGREPIKAKHLTLLSRHSYELVRKATAISINRWASRDHYKKTGEETYGEFYTGKELQALEKELARSHRRNEPTDSMLKDVAKRYKKAEKAGDPLYDDIMRHYSISERRARDLLTMCRRHPNKLLPKKKAGRPSVDQTPTKKKGK